MVCRRVERDLYNVLCAVCMFDVDILSSSLVFIIGLALALVGFPALNNVYIAVLRFFRVMPINYSHIHAQIQRKKHKRNIDFTFGLLVRRCSNTKADSKFHYVVVSRKTSVLVSPGISVWPRSGNIHSQHQSK